LKLVAVAMSFLVAELTALLSLMVLFFQGASLLSIVGYLALLSAVRLWLKLAQAR
jgi:hypothetical protein